MFVSSEYCALNQLGEKLIMFSRIAQAFETGLAHSSGYRFRMMVILSSSQDLTPKISSLSVATRGRVQDRRPTLDLPIPNGYIKRGKSGGWTIVLTILSPLCVIRS